MSRSKLSLPKLPDGLDVDELTLDPSGLLLFLRATAAQARFHNYGRTFSRFISTSSERSRTCRGGTESSHGVF